MEKHYVPGKDEEQEGYDEVGDDDVDPDVEGEGVHEGEQLRRLLLRLSIKEENENQSQDPVKKCRFSGDFDVPVKDADSQSHEGVGEVNGLFPLVGD